MLFSCLNLAGLGIYLVGKFPRLPREADGETPLPLVIWHCGFDRDQNEQSAMFYGIPPPSTMDVSRKPARVYNRLLM